MGASIKPGAIHSIVAVAALAVATGAWLIGPAKWPERVLMGAGAIVLLAMEPISMTVGAVAIAAGVAIHVVRRKVAPPDEEEAPPPLAPDAS